MWSTDAKVGVSSKVANTHDRPAHLVDHKPETAWNGKTGDLVGAWIRFRVPAGSSVHFVAITVGFDKKTEKEDLFVENHRISKLRVTHDGTSRDVDLDLRERLSKAGPTSTKFTDRGIGRSRCAAASLRIEVVVHRGSLHVPLDRASVS